MLISSFILIIIYISHRYIVAWINFYNNSDNRFGNSFWRWTYDYKVVGDRDISDLDDKSFVRKRRIRNRDISIMYCNFFIGFIVLMFFYKQSPYINLIVSNSINFGKSFRTKLVSSTEFE